MANCIKLSSYISDVTNITNIPNGMKVKFSKNVSGHPYAGCQKGISAIS